MTICKLSASAGKKNNGGSMLRKRHTVVEISVYDYGDGGGDDDDDILHTSVAPDWCFRWSRGSMLPYGTQVRGFKPNRSRWIFQGEKFLSRPSFRRKVKPSVPCCRFTACKRSLNVMWKYGIFRQNSSAISRPCTSAFGC